MAYDRIDWHSGGGEYPAGLPAENGGIHIGMFLAWAFGQGMAGEDHREDDAKELEQLARREITGLDFLIEFCDEKFTEDDLDERGNAFAIDYYHDANSAFAKQHGNYLDDYCDVFNRHAAKTFTRLQEGGDIAWNHSSYWGENDVKLAFSCGLTLPPR